ncbi:hypothetical protein KFE69_07855 [bacterium SCSIO 12844]|nr:hypothetical protein KFE69_07855 [bacterium SCSIO 12844]
MDSQEKGVYIVGLCAPDKKPGHAVLFYHDDSSLVIFDPNRSAIQYSGNYDVEEVLDKVESFFQEEYEISKLKFYNVEKGIRAYARSI